jgi:hypothetical protein
MLSFTGAPAPFPVRADDRHLQKYLQWSENIASAARAFIDTHLNGGSDSGFIGISLRNDLDWVNGFLKKSIRMYAFYRRTCANIYKTHPVASCSRRRNV